MSVHFGRWNFDGKPVDRDYLEKAKASVAPYGPDYAGSYSKNNITIVYHAFQTTKESRRETQPHVTASGAILTWDGRLDNRTALIQQLQDVLSTASTDVEIVAAAYEKWGTDCFCRLIGDWAFSIWDPHTRSLTLAKDPIGTRHLYYSLDEDQVTWSTILDPLILFAGKTFSLCEEYIAGWLSFFPAARLTPYVGINSVPPSSLVLIRAGMHTTSKYWDFDPDKQIRYRTDGEYEEHFRAVFAEAVRRRLRSDSPILAELSGGMDSSSIVCMADTVLACGAAETPRVDTVSYYNDSEPDWNERPYFTKVEEKRGRIGCHIDADLPETFVPVFANGRFFSTPGAGSQPHQTRKPLAECMTAQKNRVLLSGTGGDEVTGGLPTPAPELADLLAKAEYRRLAERLRVWALQKRRPWLHLLLEAARGFFPAVVVGLPRLRRAPPWLQSRFAQLYKEALAGYEPRLKLFGPPPSFQDNLSTLDGLRRQLGCDPLPLDPHYEKRYPFLDRSLLEFLYAIPREQLVRPGQRRSLLRRALVGVVPDELLNRKRKAFIARGPRIAISDRWVHLAAMTERMVSATLGIIDRDAIVDALQEARRGKEISIVALRRALSVELWLRTAEIQGILSPHSLPQQAVGTPASARPSGMRFNIRFSAG